MMEGQAKKLRQHYGGHHPTKDARWLGFEEAPQTAIYSNFEEFLVDPDVQLKKKEDIKNGLRGRPGHHEVVEGEAMPGKQLEILHHCLDNKASV